MDTLVSRALQCQVKDAFSATQDKSETMNVQALTIVCAGEWSSLMNIRTLASIILWPIFFLFVPLSNYLIL